MSLFQEKTMFQQLSAQVALFVNSPAKRTAARVALFALLVIASLLFPHHHTIHQLAESSLMGGGQPT